MAHPVANRCHTPTMYPASSWSPGDWRDHLRPPGARLAAVPGRRFLRSWWSPFRDLSHACEGFPVRARHRDLFVGEAAMPDGEGGLVEDAVLALVLRQAVVDRLGDPLGPGGHLLVASGLNVVDPAGNHGPVGLLGLDDEVVPRDAAAF